MYARICTTFDAIIYITRLESKVFILKKLCPNFQVLKFVGPKNIWVKRSLAQKQCWSTEIKAPKILVPKQFVKSGSVTSEILLVWAYVAKTFVAWTNAISMLKMVRETYL